MHNALWLYLWLALTAFAAGVVNSVAGGGTLLTFPALLAATTSVVANGTSTVALVPGSLAAAWGYRRQLQDVRWWLLVLTPPSIVGGLVGSLLVTQLDAQYFDALVPWLILTASVLFLCQPLVATRVKPGDKRPVKPWTIVGIAIFQFLVAIYGGYFGAGIGVLMLSALGLMGLDNIHAMNALKNVLAVFINGVSVGVFILSGAVDWRYAAVMAPTAIVGAYAGARVAQRLNRRFVRWLVIAIGFGLAGHFFYRRWSGEF
jgi:uncharacterized protein